MDGSKNLRNVEKLVPVILGDSDETPRHGGCSPCEVEALLVEHRKPGEQTGRTSNTCPFHHQTTHINTSFVAG